MGAAVIYERFSEKKNFFRITLSCNYYKLEDLKIPEGAPYLTRKADSSNFSYYVEGDLSYWKLNMGIGIGTQW